MRRPVAEISGRVTAGAGSGASSAGAGRSGCWWGYHQAAVPDG